MAFALSVGVATKTPTARRARRTVTCKHEPPAPARTRRAFLASAATALLSLSSPALSSENPEVSLASARAARADLVLLKETLSLGEFDTFRLALRAGPLGGVRAACYNLAKSSTSTQELESAQRAYKGLIQSVERLDAHALKASRGGAREGIEGELDEAVGRLDAFIGVVDQRFVKAD